MTLTPDACRLRISLVRKLLALALLAFAACNHSPTDPADPSSLPRGRLSGSVTIGPNCPVETTNPCPPSPDAYAARKVLVYDAAKSKLLFTVDIDAHGFYSIDLVPAKYVIDLKKVGIDKSSDVPANVEIHSTVGTTLNISIDTGLR